MLTKWSKIKETYNDDGRKMFFNKSQKKLNERKGEREEQQKKDEQNLFTEIKMKNYEEIW